MLEVCPPYVWASFLPTFCIPIGNIFIVFIIRTLCRINVLFDGAFTFLQFPIYDFRILGAYFMKLDCRITIFLLPWRFLGLFASLDLLDIWLFRRKIIHQIDCEIQSLSLCEDTLIRFLIIQMTVDERCPFVC